MTLRSLLLGTAMAVGLAGAASAETAAEPLKITSIKFSPTSLPATDAEMLQARTTSVATVTLADGTTKDYPLSYNVLFKNTDEFDSHAAGQLYDAKMQPIMDPKGNPVVAETPDSNSLLNVDGKLFVVTHFEYDWLLADGGDAAKTEGWYSRMPMTMTLTEVEQGADGKLTAKSVKPIDFAKVDGLWIPCAGSATPWGTHLGSEEDYDLYFQDASGPKKRAETTEGLRALSEVYFGKEKQANPYHYGFLPEVTVKADGSTEIVKHYAMGRATWEQGRVMDDNRTVYMGDDGTNVFLAMFVADAEKDLSAGTLYAAKWHQTSDADGGAADLTWIKLGHATNAEIRAIIDKGVTFDDIFESKAGTPEAKDGEPKPTPVDYTAEGFTRIRAGHSGDEWLKLKPGMEQAAAFLEPRRYAALLGATSEFNKMEGVAADGEKKNLYVAMSYIDKGMKADEGGPQDDIRVAKINAGGVYEMAMQGGQKDQTGAEIASEFVAVKAHIPAPLLGKDIEADALGNIADPEKVANPDNLSFSPAMRTLFVGEDSGTHVNNMIWAYNVDSGEMVRIMTQPSGAEATGLNVFDAMGGHAYVMANNQHQGEWIKSMPDAVKDRLEALAKESFGENGKGALTYMMEANVGYLGGLPALTR